MALPNQDKDFVQTLLSSPPSSDPPAIASIITTLSLQPHIEGGFYAETDRDKLLVPNPFQNLPLLSNATNKDTSTTRSASTTIYYLVSPKSPIGYFHRNRGRTVHTLHKGRGRYVLLHADQRDAQGRVPLETFVVGHDLAKGEKLQWIVDGGKFKASFLLPDSEGGNESEEGLLISETVVPGFEFSDHDFLTAEGFVDNLNDDGQKELKLLLKKAEQARLGEVKGG